MRKGAQLRYVRQLEKPTVFRKTLSISDIYIYICCKCLIFIKLYPFLEVRQLFVMSHLQVWYLGCKDRELIDMMEKIFRFRCALLAKWSVIFMQTAAETIRFRPYVTEWSGIIMQTAAVATVSY